MKRLYSIGLVAGFFTLGGYLSNVGLSADPITLGVRLIIMGSAFSWMVGCYFAMSAITGDDIRQAQKGIEPR